MKIALFVGDHAQDTLAVRAGWWITRLVQKGQLGFITHCEAIHAEHDDGAVTIASASLRDGGVRSKRVALDPTHWLIADVPAWSLAKSKDWFAAHDGLLYDLRGALATVLPGAHSWDRYFCSEALCASVGLRSPETFGPHHLAALSLSLGTDVTHDFFDRRMGLYLGAAPVYTIKKKDI